MSSGGGETCAAPCNRCGRTTTHRRDDAGALRCLRCVIEDSMPSNDAPTPVATPVVEMPAEVRRPRTAVEILAAVVTVFVLGFLVYAFIRRH